VQEVKIYSFPQYSGLILKDLQFFSRNIKDLLENYELYVKTIVRRGCPKAGEVLIMGDLADLISEYMYRFVLVAK
jgi:hypothetical protein